METELYKKLALLTDVEAELCLNGLLKGLTIENPSYEKLLISPVEMKKIIEEVATKAGKNLPQLVEVSPNERPPAIRLILADIAKDEKLKPKLNAWLDHSRPTMLEPVTTSLVLAGITLVLSTHIKVEYQDVEGKKKLKVKVEKEPTAVGLLEKFFGLF